MQLYRAIPELQKGWYTGPWQSHLQVSLGYAYAGVDEPHYHLLATEIYCVARGTAELRVEQDTVALGAGDVVVVAPGEAHTFLHSSVDYFHFVIQAPGLQGEAARSDKVSVPRSRLGL
ncbi:MAG: cupin domain-containing protein [Chloroflexi bacterium]|nr:cupin domain-containing protein [Chloroflexota bacterium]